MPDCLRLFVKIKLGDVVVFCAFLALVVVSACVVWARPTGSEVVFQTMEGVERCSLNEDRDLDIKGPLGVTRVEIHHGKARIVSSPCANKICAHFGSIGKKSQVIACLPNHVMIRIDGKSRLLEGEVDAVTH